jgi:hypothetical protein
MTVVWKLVRSFAAKRAHLDCSERSLAALSNFQQRTGLAISTISAASAPAAPAAGSDHLSAAGKPAVACAVLERLPLVVPEDPAWERDYQEWRQTFRTRIYKQYPDEFGKARSDEETESAKQKRSWEPEPRLTEADAAQVRASDRCAANVRVVTGGIRAAASEHLFMRP